jgi:hypothetical protein
VRSPSPQGRWAYGGKWSRLQGASVLIASLCFRAIAQEHH